MKRAQRTRAFTIIELAIVIGVIAILAILLVPVILGQLEKARFAVEKESLVELGKTMKRFHADMAAWPYEGTVWTPNQGQINPEEFSTSDTALFSNTAGFIACTPSNLGTRCWGGPYLGQGTSLGDTAMRDVWGRTRMFAYIRPYDGYSEGTPAAPNGAIVLWSRGPDGQDQTGCVSSSCTRDLEKLTKGLPSGAPSDDIIVVVSAAN